jgi:catechol-2,3-dioxygenase
LESDEGGVRVEVTLQTVILSVIDLDRSIEFYTEVFGFSVIAQREEVAVLEINRGSRSQVLALRGNPRAVHPGGGTIGAKVVGFEVATRKDLQQIEERLTERNAYVSRIRRDLSETVIGTDPNDFAIVVSAGRRGQPIQMAEWNNPDEVIEAIAQ